MRRVTIRDVAALADTSISTVSAALNGRPGVSQETRERVIDAANRLSWRPDQRASRLRRNRTAVIGVVYEADQPFQASLVDSVYATAKDQGVEVVLAAATDHHSELECLRVLVRERCDGLLLAGSALSPSHIELVARQAPLVSLCRKINERGVDEVYADVKQTMGLAIDHLFALGHTQIWHLGASGRSMGAPREQAYVHQMVAAGLDPVVIEAGATNLDGVHAADILLDGAELPTAFICYNDAMAAGLVRRLRQRGVKVPDDVSVVGYDDAPIASDPTLDLTTVSQPRQEMAVAAVGILVSRMNEEQAVEVGNERRLKVPGQLVIRTTTGRPRTAQPHSS